MDGSDKNERDLVGLGTLKSAVSQEWSNELGWFFACWYKFMKVKSCFKNYWVSMSKMGEVLMIVGLLNQVHLIVDLMNWADWLNNFCMLIMEYYFFALNDAPYWLYESCMSWKNLLPRLHAKMLITNQIAGFFKL